MHVDYLIVGRGLAGSMLALEATRRGKRVAVIHDSTGSMATEVAAGLINPVTGRRLALTERADVLFPWAEAFYRDLLPPDAAAQPCDVCRIFHSQDEVAAYEKRVTQSAYMDFFGPRLTPSEAAACGLRAPLGAVRLRRAIMLNPTRVLEAIWKRIATEVVLVEERFDHDTLHVDDTCVMWKGWTSDCLIFCDGFAAQSNPWLQKIPFQHAKGERLLVRSRDWQTDIPVISQGLHILPMAGGLYWAGGTYAWDDLSSTPTEEARKTILDRLHAMLVATFDVVDHRAAVRPVTNRRTPVLGRLADASRLAVFNGLGSKGFLRAPYYAHHLLDHLIDGTSLDQDVDLHTHLTSTR